MIMVYLGMVDISLIRKPVNWLVLAMPMIIYLFVQGFYDTQDSATSNEGKFARSFANSDVQKYEDISNDTSKIHSEAFEKNKRQSC